MTLMTSLLVGRLRTNTGHEAFHDACGLRGLRVHARIKVPADSARSDTAKTSGNNFKD